MKEVKAKVILTITDESGKLIDQIFEFYPIYRCTINYDPKVLKTFGGFIDYLGVDCSIDLSGEINKHYTEKREE